MNPTPHTQKRTRGSRGFTLTEILIALGIFALGSVAVASLFPSALLLQKRTVEASTAQAFEASVRAQLLGRGFRETDLQGIADNLVVATPDAVINSADAPALRWSLMSRSSGSRSESPADRTLFWVPLFMDRDPAGPTLPTLQDRRWSVFVFLVRAEEDTDYPKAAAAPIAQYAMPADPTYVPGVARRAVTYREPTASPPRPHRFDLSPGGNLRNGRRIILPGDEVLDQGGAAHRVLNATDDDIEISGPLGGFVDGATVNIWYADPGPDARGSAFVDVFELTDDGSGSSFLVH